MTKGQVTLPVFQSLEAFWPGVLTLVGDIDAAMRIMMNYYQVLKQYGFTPEFYNIPSLEAVHKRSGYPLRPELAESLMYLYRATEDPLLLQIGAELIEAIEHSTRTSCGYATVHDVKDHIIEDRMESFFLSETTKYLYLLFDVDNFVHKPGLKGDVIQTPNGQCVLNSGGYIFNTEAHIFDPAAVYCCGARRQRDVKVLAEFQDNLDLLTLFGLDDDMGEDERNLDEEFFKSETDDELKSAAEGEKRGRHTSAADVEYEVDGEGERRSLDSDQTVVESSTPSSTVAEASGDAKSPSALNVGAANDPNLLKKIDELTDQWSDVLKWAAKAANELTVVNKKDYRCKEKESGEGVCRVADRDTGSPAFNALLKYIYSKKSISIERRKSIADRTAARRVEKIQKR